MNSSIPGTIPTRKTKIVATLGPASCDRKVIRELIQSGMNVARFNFSHGTYESHAEVLKLVREEARALGTHVAVFQDLCGPKVRIGDIKNGEITLETGKTVLLKHGKEGTGNEAELYVEAFDPKTVIKPGEKALLADGRIELVAQETLPEGVNCLVQAGGDLRARSGIAVPDSMLNLPCLTAKDLKDLEWGVEYEVDYIALSFVGKAEDIIELRSHISRLGGSNHIIAKIERATSLDNLVEIVEAADAVMVARGDLGLELPLERVPGAQRLIIQTSIARSTPVITATQMLQSMVQEIRPTRAEVSDVCTAIRDGTDAVMLSEETAIGQHPVEAVKVLNRILKEGEKEILSHRTKPRYTHQQSSVADAVCYAATEAAEKISASAILCCTVSGYSARLMAKYRPKQLLFAATSREASLSRMALHWGVNPVHIAFSNPEDHEEEIPLAIETLRDHYGLKPGSRVVVTAGLRANVKGTTSVMEVRDVPRKEES